MGLRLIKTEKRLSERVLYSSSFALVHVALTSLVLSCAASSNSYCQKDLAEVFRFNLEDIDRRIMRDAKIKTLGQRILLLG